MSDKERIQEDGDEIRRALQALPVERPVTAAQAAVLAAKLKESRTRRRRFGELALAATIAMVAFLAGRTTVVPAAVPAEPAYMLLVHDDLPPQADSAKLHEEYGRWAAGLAEGGRLSGGEELGDTRLLLEPGAGSDVARTSARSTRSIGGYFLLTVGNEAEALAIARDCPHLKRGGTVEVREIVRQ
ncbi:MAG: hypothetical protein JJE51_01685 [Thermoanaerobaculia bacterium]|nr:hypothetical protein [Thermoanaerobaculia bacterium]